MAFIPASGIKLGLDTEFGQSFANATGGNLPGVNVFGSLDPTLYPPSARKTGLTPPGYIHIPTSVCLCGRVADNDSRISACQNIVTAAGTQLEGIHVIKTGNLSRDDNGNVLLEIVSPEIQTIIKNMEHQLEGAGTKPAIKSNPVHIIIRKGRFTEKPNEQDEREIAAIMSNPAILQLCNRTFSLAGAQFGTMAFAVDSVNITTPIKTLTAPPVKPQVTPMTDVQTSGLTPAQVSAPEKTTVTTIEALNSLRRRPPIPATDDILSTISEITAYCNDNFSNVGHHGNAALNRMTLRNSYVAERLTPEVIHYIFTCPDTEMHNLTLTRGTNLRNVIFYGFGEGLASLQYLPNNTYDYDINQFRAQQRDFPANTMRIVENIAKATQLQITEEAPDSSNINSQFKQIITTINLIKRDGLTDRLLNIAADVTAASIHSQVHNGFTTALQGIELSKEGSFGASKVTVGDEIFYGDGKNPITIDTLAEKLLSNDEVWVFGPISHLFYDRVHLEAALEQDVSFYIDQKPFSYRELFQKMVEQLNSHPSQYNVARLQFSLRFALIDKHLNKSFLAQYEQAKQSVMGAAAAVAEPPPLANSLQSMFHHQPTPQGPQEPQYQVGNVPKPNH